MAIEWLVLWGAGKAVGTLAKPVLEDLAKDIAKDQGKSLFGKAMKRAAKLISHDEYLKLYGKAIKELAEVIDEELQNAGIAADNIDVYAKDLKQFVRSEPIREILPNAFASSAGVVEGYELKRCWPDLAPLPPDFDWDYVAKTFNRKLKKLREDDADFRAVLQAQAARETAENTKQILGVQPDFNLEKYRESLLESHQHLKLELLDPNGSSYKVQLRSVFVPQTVRDCQEYVPQVFEIPKEHLARLRKEGGLDESLLKLSEEMIETRRRSYLEQSPRSVLEVVADNRHSHLVILGSPGSGKSTLLKALALEWAQLPTAKERTALPLPLFIELNHYHRSGEKGFLRYLHDGRIACQMNQGQLDEVLKRRGGAVLLLDGLDEIFELQGREDTLNDIQRFSNDYPDTPVIVTSRIIGYQQKQLSEAGFRHFMLQDLDDEQIEDFLNRWHQTFVPEAQERNAKRRRLAEAISSSRAIRELADNPLLLTMMSILNLHQELPRDRVQLYEQASRVLLHQWDVERLKLKVTLDYKEKAEMLRRLALRMQNAPGGLKGNLIAGEELERLFRDYFKQELEHPDPRTAAREMVQQLRERNYILCLQGHENFSFVHRTLLEYFCASALVRHSLQAASSVEFLKQEVFAPHWREEIWHEVLRLITGMDDQVPVQRVAELIDFLLAEKDDGYEFHNIFLAANCCLEVRNPRALGDTRTHATDALLQLTQFDFLYYYKEYEEEAQRRNEIRAKAIRYLANPQLFDSAHTWLKDRAAKDDNGAVRQAAVQELARGWKDDPDTLTILKDRAAKDDDNDVRQAAVQELARGWKDDPDTLTILKDRAAKDDNGAVRQAAVQELARGWKDDPDTLTILKDRAAKDDNFAVRQAAAQELARGWKDDPDTLTILKDRAAKDDNWAVRQAAVQELARGWKDDPDTLTILKDRAAKDDDNDVRQAAVQELARGWKDDPDTLTILKDRAAKDDDNDVRQAAVQELARGWKDDPDTLTILKDRAAKDDNWAVRQAAVQELARGWKDDPDTLTILKDRAAKDDNGAVRQAAVQELARGWKDDPDTLTWLKDRAAKDDDNDVRQAAVQELARGWKDDPDTLTILKDRAAKDDNWAVRQAAVQELARGWKDDPDTLTWLKDRAAKDDDNDVRQAAVQELARGWKDDPDTLTILKDRAAKDDNWAVRQAAVQELARGWKDDPDTLTILKDRAAKDDNGAVRKAAVQELARGWKDDPDTLTILKDRAAKDDNGAVRKAAVQELARGWKDDKDTLTWLKDRAVNDAMPEADWESWQKGVRDTALQAIARGWWDDPETLTLLREREKNDPTPWLREKAKQMADKLEAKGMTPPLPGVKP